jgi:RHS repeat-associated protein
VDFTWDHRNRLTAVTFKTSAGVTTKKVVYAYDMFNVLISRRVDSNGDGTFDSGQRFVYDTAPGKDGLSDIVLVFDDSGSLTNRYLHGPAVDQVFADEDALGEILWGLTDHQGTVRDVVDYNAATDTTSVVNHLKYDSFGTITSQTNSALQPLLAWTGRYRDPDTGLQWNLNRWYDPVIGRWLSEDPIGFAGADENLARYVGNSPLSLSDPSGESAVGKLARETAIRRMKAALRHQLAKRLAQIHHVIPQHLYRDPTLGPWLRNLGIGKNHTKNLIPLPTVKGKAAGLGAKRALHAGGHLRDYFDKMRDQLQSIYKRHAAKTLSDAEAKAAVESIQRTMKRDLRDGRVLLHNEAALMKEYGPLLALGLAGASEQELDRIAKGQAEALGKTIEQHAGALVRMETYLGSFGKWLDYLNPADDVATLYDLERMAHIMSGRDPSEPSAHANALETHQRVTGRPFFSGPKW